MIPKIIHYVWFSDPPNYTEDVLKCIESWKKHLPDYEIKLWNAKNFDFSLCEYAREAYTEGKYAFASDYVRLWALYNYGGIYLDSDIEVLKSFDELLNNKAFTGFESPDRIAAWIFASEKNNPIFKKFLDDYEGRRFVLGNGVYDLTPNPVPITNALIDRGLRLDNTYQELEDITIYPMDYFCPFNPYRSEGDCFTDHTYANHHFNGEWKKVHSDKERNYQAKELKYQKIFGKKIGKKLCRNFEIIRCKGISFWIKQRRDNKKMLSRK
ncbi:MAG: glycosyl transferase [Lachnospiraceae bacterium]|nr:glycosyl transferase [Lachnospiraceae bacterium]